MLVAILVLLLAGRIEDRFSLEELEEVFVLRDPHYVISHPLMPAGRFLADKPSSCYRVFLLGGSQAMGSPFTMQQQGTGDELMGWLELPNEGGIATWLEAYLTHALSGREVEVLNTTICGLGSTHALATFHRIEEVGDPDQVILLSGNNERLDYADFNMPENADMAEVLQQLGEDYRTNIQEFADVANRRRIPLLLLTVPSNIRDWMPEDEIPFDADQVKTLIAEGQLSPCLDYLQPFEDDQNALVSYFMARCHDDLGDRQTAYSYYVEAKDRDRSLLRARTPWNDMLRTTPSTAFVQTLDLEPVVARLSQDGLPGDDEFFDYCHMKLHLNQQGAKVIATHILETSFPSVDPAVLDQALLPVFGGPQLKRLYWLKRIKWLRYRYRSTVPWVRDENTARTLDSYRAEFDDVDTRIYYIEQMEPSGQEP